MKIMISQPMQGKTREEILADREEMVLELQKKGYEVLDTLLSDLPEGKNTPVHYLAKSIEFMAEADGIVFLEGWENARGCRIEYSIAKYYNKFIMEIR